MAQKYLFAANDPSGTEIWITDGTADGTYLLKDINAGTGSSSPMGFTPLGNGKTVFSAYTDADGQELWVTDGTTGGTRLVRNIVAGTGSSGPRNFSQLENGKALFSAYDPVHGGELWITDGTSAGTKLVKDINPGTGNSSVSNFQRLGNGTAVFVAGKGADDYELWVTDGTSAGTKLLKDINPGSASSLPNYFFRLANGKLLFAASNADYGTEMWITDGTPGGTYLLKDINVGAADAFPQSFASLGNGKVLFSARQPGTGDELWVTDGTAAGTSFVKDLNPGSTGSSPEEFALLIPGRAVFRAADQAGSFELWVTDGTAAGTALVKDIYPGSIASFPRSMTSLGNGKVVFQAGDPNFGSEIWVTDGTANGTKLLKDIYPDGGSSQPYGFTPLGDGRVLFSAINPDTGQELWVTDGTAAGTMLVEDLFPGPSGSSPNGFTDITPPPRPDAPILYPGYDSGISSTDGLTKYPQLIIVGYAEAGSTVALFDGTTQIGSGKVGSEGKYAIVTPLLPDGQHAFSVTATDAAGNTSATSAALNVEIDTSVPTRLAAPKLAAASDTGASATDRITKDATPTFTGTAEAGTTVTLYDGSTAVGTALAGSTGAYSVTASALLDAVHTFTVTATDRAGNVSTASPPTNVTIDTITPTASSKPVLTAGYDTGASNTDGITKSTKLILTGAGEAGSTVTLLDGSTQVGSVVVAATGMYRFTLNAVAEGSHSYKTYASDKAGNVSTTSAATVVNVDTTKPLAPTKPVLPAAYDTGLSNSDGITKSTRLVFTGTAEAGSSVTLLDGSTLIGSVVTATNGSYRFDLMGIAEGAHRYIAYATDKAGNIGPRTAATPVTVYTTAPNVAITSPGGNATRANQTITGTGEAGTTVTITRNGTTFGTTTVAADGTWSRNLTLTAGSNRVVATDTDTAGNVGTSTAVTYSYTPSVARQMAVARGPDGTAHPDVAQASFARALFDATFSPASELALPMHAAAMPHPVLAAPS